MPAASTWPTRASGRWTPDVSAERTISHWSVAFLAVADSSRQPPPGSGQRLRDAIAEVVASAGTGLVDLAATGTPSAGALAPVLALGIRISSDALTRRRDRGARALDAAAEQVGSLQRLEKLATADDARLELTARTLEAAMRTTLEGKIRALGRVLAAGLDGQATVDQAHVLSTALAHIEAPHVQVLDELRGRADTNAAAAESERAKGSELLSMSRENLLERLPGHRDVLDSVMQVLGGQYLVVPVSLGLSIGSWGGPGRWAVTDLGRACLDRLAEAAETAE